jgi:DNA-binding MarR family transcriptional regulator
MVCCFLTVGGQGMLRSKPQAPRKAAVQAKRQTDGKARAVDYEALAQFRFQLRRFLSFSEAAARNAGLTPQQHQALLAIKGFSRTESLSVGELAEFLLVRHHTAVELVDRMTKLRLIERITDHDDSRRILVKLTRKGEQKLRMLSKTHLQELQAVSPTLTGILQSFSRS